MNALISWLGARFTFFRNHANTISNLASVVTIVAFTVFLGVLLGQMLERAELKSTKAKLDLAEDEILLQSNQIDSVTALVEWYLRIDSLNNARIAMSGNHTAGADSVGLPGDSEPVSVGSQFTFSGAVTDSRGDPVNQAMIVDYATGSRVYSKPDGSFSIPAIQDNSAVVSHERFMPRAITTSNETQGMTVILKKE